MAIRAILCDFGGVLIKTGDPSGQQKWERDLGLSHGGLVDVVLTSAACRQAFLGHISVIEMWQRITQTLNLSLEQVYELQHDFHFGDRLDGAFVEFLRQLRPHHKIAILSNAWSNGRAMITDRFGLADLVDTMIISSEEGVAKPDIAIYQIAARRLEMRPDEIVFIDDLRENVEAARKAGMHIVHFKTTEQAIKDVLKLCESR